MWGLVGASCESVYSASKGAIIAFTKSLAKEYASANIRVNAVAPGLIDTDMNASLSESDKAAICDETPLMRMGKAEEVADALFFLASDSASFVTGEIMNISGGLVV